MAYGTVNADVIGTSVAGSNLGAGNASIMKNRIINGAMVIDQRNAGASVTLSADTYTLDRWIGYASAASKMSIQQNAGSVTPPTGYTYYLGATSLTAYTPLAATDVFGVSQAIEGYNIADLGWGTANAKTITISFQVYSSLTGTFGGLIRNNAGTRAYGFTYSIPVANTWTTISTTIAGDTSGTWLTTNELGLRLIFDLGTGSTYRVAAGSWTAGNYYGVTGATSVVGTSGATFYITGVQLEVGSSATGFEYRQYQQELALCQRYYYRLIPGNGNRFGVGQITASTGAAIFITFMVSMRTSPTALEQTGTGTDYRLLGSTGSGVAGNGVPTFNSASTDSILVGFSVASGVTAGDATVGYSNAVGAYLGFSAEL